jgi:hypothetical protein
MKIPATKIWEDEKYVYIPEEIFEHLPSEFREKFEATKELGKNVLRIADADLKHLISLSKAIPTSMSLSYIYSRLRTAEFDLTMEAVLEQEMLTTAFIVTYSRLFTKATGVRVFSRDVIPGHLKSVHDEIIDIRHRRYAHNGGHETLESGLEIFFSDSKFQVNTPLSLRVIIGGRDEWKELISFIDLHIYEALYKILGRLKKNTGYEWTYPTGPKPDWKDEN